MVFDVAAVPPVPGVAQDAIFLPAPTAWPGALELASHEWIPVGRPGSPGNWERHRLAVFGGGVGREVWLHLLEAYGLQRRRKEL
jgi:hypothetical protein